MLVRSGRVLRVTSLSSSASAGFAGEIQQLDFSSLRALCVLRKFRC